MSVTSVFSQYPATPTTVLGRLTPANVGVSTQASELLAGEWIRRFRRNQATRASGGSRAPMAPMMYVALDATVFTLARPWKLHLRDRLAFVVTTPNAGTPALGAWGFWQMLSDGPPPTWVGIGFYARSGDDQWYAFIKDSSNDIAVRDLFVLATGVSASVLRNLHIEVDANLKRVVWRINGVQVASYTFIIGTQLDKMGTIPPPITWALWTDGVTAPSQDVSLYATMSGANEGLAVEFPEVGKPDKPTIAVVGAPGGSFVDLSGSAYSHPLGIVHRSTVWQVDEAGGDFSTPVREILTSLAPLVSVRIGSLTPSTNYIARVAYIDANFVIGDFSDSVAFATSALTGVVPLSAPDCTAAVFTEVTG